MKFFLGVALSCVFASMANASLLAPNPFVPKNSFLPEAIKIFDFTAQRPYDDGSLPQVSETTKGIYELNYGAYKLWVDCATRRTIHFEFAFKKAGEHLPQLVSDQFYREPKLPSYCQQTSALPYGSGYTRTQLVNAKFFAAAPFEKALSNTMTNIFPLSNSPGPFKGNIGGFHLMSWNEVTDYVWRERLEGNISVAGELHWDESREVLPTHGLAAPAWISITVVRYGNNVTYAKSFIVPN